jgi:PAS domain-containing protein
MNLEKAITHRLPRWATFWERITQPAASLTTKDSQQQARLLATISLTFLLLGLMAMPPWVITSASWLWAASLASGMLIIFVLAYWLSRTYHYTRGAVLLSLSIFLLVTVNMGLSPSPIAQRMLMLMALVVGVMISILFLRRRFTMMLIGICFAIITAHFFVSDLPFIYPFAYAFFFMVLMGLAIVTHTVGQYYRRELADSEARYRALFQQSHDAVFILSLNGQHIEANQRAADMLG